METGQELSKKETVFKELDVDDFSSEPTEIESLCLKCGQNGTTTLLLTKIPFYKEIIIMSFTCPHCGFCNNETQFGGKIQDTGIRIKVLIQNVKDLNRRVVRSDFASISIPELDFEIPPLSRKGEVTTIEGIVSTVLSNLEADQTIRRKIDPLAAEKIDEFIERLKHCRELKVKFHFVIVDPSGNSFVENINAPNKDEGMDLSYYKRSQEDDEALGIVSENGKDAVVETTEPVNQSSSIDTSEEILNFPTNCFHCNAPCSTQMKITKIPHFKEVVIMATTCDACGHRTNEVKSGAGIEPLGTKIILNITNHTDLSRDVLKSETCGINIPELEFEMGAGSIGGKFTTLEGLLQNIKEQLVDDNPFVKGDSAESDIITKMKQFSKKLDEVLLGKRKVQIIFDDPAGNSYVQNLYAPESDPEMEVIKYERNFEQNDELGLNDMKLENY